MKIKKAKPMMCEWNRNENKLAYNHEAHSPATLILGEKNYRVCARCAELKKFSTMKIMSIIHH